MKSVLLKLDDDLFKETETRVRELKTSRNSYIKKALEAYNKFLERKTLERQLAFESSLLSDESKLINQEFDATLGDGLNNGY